jgi:CHAT domain-containing protein/tetratricopeptide (TPR) repeat protein
VGDRAGEGTTLSNIGGVYRDQGRYAEALEMYQQALVIQREVGDRTGEGSTLTGIGMVYDNQGRYAEALEMYYQALVIQREVGDRTGEEATLNNIGAVYADQGRYAEALEMYQQALVIQREVGDRSGEGTTLSNIGFVYYNQGRYAEALESYEQALTIRREAGDRAGEGNTLNNIGGVYDDQGRYVEALENYQQALVIQREVGDRAGEGIILNNIGIARQAQGRYAEALDNYRQAMEVFEAIRATAGGEQGRSGFIAQHAHLYARAAGLFHQQGQDEEAFFTSEQGRARAFLDSLATGHVELSDDEAAALLAQEQEAYAARQAAQDALARARAFDPPDPTLVANLEAQLAQAEAAYAAALAAIEARGDQLAALVPGRSTVLGLSEVQALLDEGTTLLSYFVLEDQTLAFVITRSSFEVIAIEASRQELTDRVSYFRDVIPFKELEATRTAAKELYQMLIAPLSPSLHTSRLAIVPHGPLHYLPFAALQSPDTGQYFLEQHVLVTLPSASALPFILQNRSSPASVGGSVLILGDPTAEELPPLIFAEGEAQAIADLYRVQPLLGQAATESAVRERAAQARVVHLAAHGEYNLHNPLYSALALAPDGDNDGRLEVHEIYGLDLTSADLVVLSACQTQLGELSAGDELVGLTRAFFFAGTPTVVASLWNVDDEATGLLMERFYTYLGQGMSKAAALRQAQLEVMEDYPDPYYWAGFVLSGDGGKVSEGEILALTPTAAPMVGQSLRETPAPLPDEPEPPSPSNWVWLLAGAGVLIVLIVGWVLWRRAIRHLL